MPAPPLQAELTKTKNGVNQGNDAIGIPSFYAVLGAEYDIRPIEGLTATARVNHSGTQYADLANTKSWTATPRWIWACAIASR